MVRENIVGVMGYLADDPQIRKTYNGKDVCNFTIGVNRDKENTDWIDCTAWNNNALFISRYARKGDPVYVRGSINTDFYMPRDYNKKIKRTVINCIHTVLLTQHEKRSMNDGLVPQQDGYSGYSDSPYPPTDKDVPF